MSSLGGSGQLEGRVAAVTGGGGAIGLEIVARLLEEGAYVGVSDVNEEALVAARTSLVERGHLEERIHTHVLDVTKEEDVKNWIKAIDEKWHKGIDVVVANAARFVFGKVEEVTEEAWDKVLNCNVKGYAFTCKHAVPYLKKSEHASIVVIASISSFIAQPCFVPYNTSKGAVLQMMRCMALDLGSDNIRVNAVCPGTIDTPATDNAIKMMGVSKEELISESCKKQCVKRLGTRRDVANAVLFLSSDESLFISGTPLMVDGGYTTL
eukprot:TRINITY_DN16817_c0_g1_i1.p1 TRINITY_DN16817_c0_g1~~TRINITY_DN16817_c0_g1_i1.p1  ORF type:complete len:273 (-),score=64.45 TRINITY_DN16817_c0_g1_i1:620-1417(-)